MLESKIIRASAGSGKTFELANRYLAILAAGEAPERILATTFTKKAAGEIRERIFKRLLNACRSEREAEALSGHLGTKVSSSDAMALLYRLIDKQGQLQISTFDSLFLKVAALFGLELGLSPGWRVADDAVVAQLHEWAMTGLLERSDKGEIVQLLRLSPRRANSRSVHEGLLNRLSRLVDEFGRQGVKPWLQLSPSELIPPAIVPQVIEGLHTTELPKTKDGKPHKSWVNGIAKLCQNAESRNWKLVLESGLLQSGLANETYYKMEYPEPLRALLLGLAKVAAQNMISTLADYNRATGDLLARFYGYYVELRERYQALSFADVKAVLAGSGALSDLNQLYFRLDTRFNHLLLDEFQDTSPDEWRVIEPIVGEVLSGDLRTFFCVGDPKQAIYGWRGGVSEIFDELELRFPQLNVETRQKSFRSANTVIEIVNDVFAKISANPAIVGATEPVRKAAAKWEQSFTPHLTERLNLKGYLYLERLPERGKEEENEEEQLNLLHRRTAEIVEGIQANTDCSLTIGILLRANKQVQNFVTALKERGIAVSADGRSPLLDAEAVQLVLTLLKLIDHPGDTLAAHLVSRTILDLIAPNQTLSALVDQLRQELIVRGYGETLSRVTSELVPHLSSVEARKIFQLQEKAYEFDRTRGVRVEQFIRFISEIKAGDVSPDSVRIMTIHAAKGLEFDAVILPEITEPVINWNKVQVISKRRSPLSDPEVITQRPDLSLRAVDQTIAQLLDDYEVNVYKEALSLLYVALTRARHALYLLDDGSRRGGVNFASIVSAALNYEGGEPLTRGEKEWFGVENKQEEEPATISIQPIQRGKVAPLRPLWGYQRKQPSRKAFVSLQEGTVIHQLLAAIQWLDSETGSKIDAVLEKLTIDRSMRLYFREKLEAALSKPQLKELLNKPANGVTRVLREQPFSFVSGRTIVNGVIDRLVFVESPAPSIDIIDFKTDTLSEHQVPEMVQRYSEQLLTYREAISRLYPKTAIKLKLAFTVPGIVVEVQS